jgi:hypothetical protein
MLKIPDPIRPDLGLPEKLGMCVTVLVLLGLLGMAGASP